MNRARHTFLIVFGFLFVLSIPAGKLFAQSTEDELTKRLTNIQEQMATIAAQMQQNPLGEETLLTQKAITDELRLLVGQFSSGGESQSGNATPRQTPSSAQSGTAAGKGVANAEPGSADSTPSAPPSEKDLVLGAWGNLPSQSGHDRTSEISPKFLPLYERMIREYYRRMAR